MIDVIHVLERSHVECGLPRFPADVIALQLVRDAGIDAQGLSKEQVEKAIRGEIGRVDDVAFMCNEVLNEYTNGSCEDIRIACGLTSVILYLNCVEQGSGDAEFVFWKVIRLLSRFRSKIDLQSAWDIAHQLTREI